MAANKKTTQRVPVLTFAYDEEDLLASGRDTFCVEDMHYTLEYRSALPKGCLYPDELAATVRCLSKQKTVHFEKQPPSPVGKHKVYAEECKQREEEAAALLKKLNADPKSKERKLKSLVKRAGVEFKL